MLNVHTVHTHSRITVLSLSVCVCTHFRLCFFFLLCLLQILMPWWQGVEDSPNPNPKLGTVWLWMEHYYLSWQCFVWESSTPVIRHQNVQQKETEVEMCTLSVTHTHTLYVHAQGKYCNPTVYKCTVWTLSTAVQLARLGQSFFLFLIHLYFIRMNLSFIRFTRCYHLYLCWSIMNNR